MGKVTASVPLLVVIAYLLQGITGIDPCSTKGINGIKGCECNIMEARDDKGKPRSNWAKYLPTGVEQFGLRVKSVQNLAYLCEGGTVAILYDCNNRIPLYAATMISGEQLSGSSGDRPTIHFLKSGGLKPSFQQTDADYEDSRDSDSRSKKRARSSETDNDDKRFPPEEYPAMHKGHLIASHYGYGNKQRKIATFTYTNVVPQFASLNQGAWRVCEQRLIKWGKYYCAVEGAQMFIVVGAIPSTNTDVRFGKGNTPSYFGMKRFNSYKVDEYRVNVPRYMWTAACCKYTVKGILKYNSTAFWRQNDPKKEPCNRLDVHTLSQSLFMFRKVNLFPRTPQCNDKNNFIPLP